MEETIRNQFIEQVNRLNDNNAILIEDDYQNSIEVKEIEKEVFMLTAPLFIYKNNNSEDEIKTQLKSFRYPHFIAKTLILAGEPNERQLFSVTTLLFKDMEQFAKIFEIEKLLTYEEI